MSKACPYCGNVVDDHIEKCPRCGLDFANRTMQPATSTPSSPGSPGGFPTAPDPFSSPGIWNPAKGQPVLQPVRTSNFGRRITIATIALIVLGGLGALFFYVTKEVTKRLDDDPPANGGNIVLESPLGAGNGNGNGNGNGKGGGGNQEDLSVSGSRELFRQMNRNGAKCTGYNQVIETSIVDAASCFAGTEAWTIQVFHDDLSYDAVVANYRSNDGLDVAFGGNWTVLVQSEKSARKIARATGGDWS
ncbi:MAG TPA: hypothetical protein VIG64_07120 [Actinomycetota bacterium]|jgi:hypothetical protein